MLVGDVGRSARSYREILPFCRGLRNAAADMPFKFLPYFQHFESL